MANAPFYLKYTPEDGGEGFVRADQVIAIRDGLDLGKLRTAIELAAGHTFYAKEPAAELVCTLRNAV